VSSSTAKTGERTTRRRAGRSPSLGKHVSATREERFPATFVALGELAFDGATVSANVIDLMTGDNLVAIDDRIVVPTANLGAVLLLIEVSARLTNNEDSGYGILDKASQANVGYSGIWQHLQAPALPVGDLATLIGSSNDNLATNLLLQRVGLNAIRLRAETLGLKRTALLDIVRDVRGPDDAPQLSVGSVTELAWLFGALARGEIVDFETSQRVMGWLSLNTDLSMVASAFGLDPLAHRHEDHALLLVNKTGSDVGVRVEAGVLRGTRAGLSYAVTVKFEETSLASRLRVLGAMRTIGEELLDYVN
jgi:beta-lactamase class A